jgi:hypothetical protein
MPVNGGHRYSQRPGRSASVEKVGKKRPTVNKPCGFHEEKLLKNCEEGLVSAKKSTAENA